MEAHVPFGTTYTAPSPCGPSGVDPNPDAPCFNPSGPVPGPPGQDVHNPTWRFSLYRVDPGKSVLLRYKVTVNPSTTPGTHLTITAPSPKPRQDTPAVVVTVS